MKGNITHGQGAGSTPNDKGSQGGSGVDRTATEAQMLQNTNKWGDDSQKEQGYVNVKGTK